MDNKVLHLGIEKARQALEEKDMLESLSFAIMIKLCFRSSRINHEHTQGRALKAFLRDNFSLGYLRGKRCIENGLKYGYLRMDEDGNIVANKVYSHNSYARKVSLKEFYGYQTKKVDGKLIKRSKLTIEGVMDALRMLVMANHTRVQTAICNTINKHDAEENPRKRKAIGKKLQEYDAKGKFDKLSNKRVQDITNTKRAKAQRIMDILNKDGVVSKIENFEPLTEVAYDPITQRQEWTRAGMAGFIRWKNGKPVVQLANTYVYSESNNKINFMKADFFALGRKGEKR